MFTKKLINYLKALPYEKQLKIRNIALSFLSIFPLRKKISYKGYTIDLNTRDDSALLIYLQYLLYGTWHHESFEQKIIGTFIDRVAPKKIIFFDVGASYGMYTFLVSKYKNISSIIAIEAYKPVYECLKKNLERNNIDSVNLLNLVISDEDGDDYLTTEFSHSEWNQFKRTSSVEKSIKSATLDTLIEQYKKPDDTLLVKIDIEGNEPAAISGLIRNLSNSDINIMLEFHVGLLEARNGAAYDFAKTLLSIKNITVFLIDPNKEALFPIKTQEQFFKLIDEMKTAPFPLNLSNLFLAHQKNIQLFDDFIKEP